MIGAASPVLTIRTARRDDIPTLNDLIARSARVLSHGYYNAAETETAIRKVFGVDSRLIEDGTYYCITNADGQPVACGGWSRRATLFGGDQAGGRTDRLLSPATEAARIRAFFVAPECARQGVGRMLLNHCIAAASAEGFTALALMATLPGVPFYARHGFVAGEEQLFDHDGVTLRFVPMRRPIGE